MCKYCHYRGFSVEILPFCRKTQNYELKSTECKEFKQDEKYTINKKSN